MKRFWWTIFPIISLSVTVALDCLLPAVFAEPVATLNGQPIDREEVERRDPTKLYRLRWEIYDTLKTEAEKLADDLLLADEAKRRGMTVDELLEAEVDAKAKPPSDQEIAAYIKEQGIPAEKGDEMYGRVAAYLTDRGKIQRRLDFLEELRKKADYQFLLEPPERPRVQIDVNDDPARGNPDAPVTIIHFASFSCEICAESARRIERLMNEYPGQIRWVHRDFINIFDERGLRAAEAGETAHASGKFWEFHDHIYTLNGEFEQDALGDILEKVGVESSQYEQAHKDAVFINEIRNDIQDGAKAGVTSVPVLFVNGRYFSGTFPYEQLKAMVEEELRVAGMEAKEGI
ncbi:MAG: thioredoxin domain-containing protein [Candidatus Abyssubacteria bacterium]